MFIKSKKFSWDPLVLFEPKLTQRQMKTQALFQLKKNTHWQHLKTSSSPETKGK